MQTHRNATAEAEGWSDRQDASDAPAWVLRVDRGELLAAHERPDGTLLIEGFAAREGILEYRQADGRVVRELVTEQTLLDSAGTLGRAPVTLEHPSEDVTPDNYADLGVGDVDGEVRMEAGGFVRVKMAVRRRDAIDAVQVMGVRELSPGYKVQIDPTPGVHPVHGRYDAVQVRRVYNHLAIVERARGGPEVRLRADSGDAVATSVIVRQGDGASTRSGAQPQGARVNARLLPLLALLGITSRVDSDDAAIDAAVDALTKRKDAAEKADEKHRNDAAAQQAKIDALTGERDAEKARADKAEAELETLREAEAARQDAAERDSLGELAKALGVDVAKHDSAPALRRAIAEAHLGQALRADASDDYVRAVVDLAKASAEKRGDGRDAGVRAWAGTPPTTTHTDGAPQPPLVSSTMRDRWGGRPVGGDK